MKRRHPALLACACLFRQTRVLAYDTQALQRNNDVMQAQAGTATVTDRHTYHSQDQEGAAINVAPHPPTLLICLILTL